MLLLFFMIKINQLKKIIELIYANIPENLFYHTLQHTLQVEESGLKIANKEGITSEEDLIRLKSAIYIHDIGNLIERKDHEQRGVEFAYNLLPYLGASEKDLKIIDGIIMATKIPQNPKTNLERIMCDADLSLMGYKNWISVIDNYRKELGTNDMLQWYQGQINFLSSHNWFTESAALLYNSQKIKNIGFAQKEINKILDK